MKIFAILIMLMCVAGIVRAEESNFVFEIDVSTREMQSSYGPTNDYTGPIKARKSDERCRVFVTSAQFAAGYSALPVAVVDAALDMWKDDSASFKDWPVETKALAKATLDAINILRSDAGLAEYSDDQWKAKLKSEM